MAQLPLAENTTQNAIFKMYEDRAENRGRPHLGASVIGHDCHRYLWYLFRWAHIEKHEGRLLRLFETGTLQEKRLIENLQAAGVMVKAVDEDGEQFAFQSVGGHFGGSMDGAALGLVEAPKTWHVLEFKTANGRSFADIAKKGVEIAKPMHFAQMQLYMGWAILTRAMYIAVNKDNDDIYTERIEFNKRYFDALVEKAVSIISAEIPAIALGVERTSMPCKWCPMVELCHGTAAPEVSCRTCVHVTPELDGNARWSCREHGKDLTLAEQRNACSKHLHIPNLLENFATVKSAGLGSIIYRNNINPNRTIDQPTHSSHDITNCEDKSKLGHDYVSDDLITVEIPW